MLIQGYPDPGEGLRLQLNENTGGCSAAVLEAIRRVRPSDVSTYPSYRDAVIATAAHFEVDPDCVLLTNGLDEGILMAAVGPVRITVLGSGTSVGVPTIGCDCRVCRSTDPRDQRLRPSVLVGFEGHHVLIDTSPDFRAQALLGRFSTMTFSLSK